MNPYEQPVADSPLSRKNGSSNRRPWFLPLLLFTVSIGSFLGSRFISPFIHSFGDPQGKGSGIAIGGFIAMILYFGWHRYRRFVSVPAARSNVSVFGVRYSLRSLLVAVPGLLFVALGTRTLYTAAVAINQDILHWLPVGRRMSFGFDGLSVASNTILFVIFGIVATFIGGLCLWASDRRP